MPSIFTFLEEKGKNHITKDHFFVFDLLREISEAVEMSVTERF